MRRRWPPQPCTLVQAFRSLGLLGGLTLLGGMLWHVGFAGLIVGLHTLGPWIVPFCLFDSISLLLHTAGWASCFPGQQRHVRLWYLCLVRIAGSAINQVTPTADLGGEVVKVLLLGGVLPRAQTVAAVVIDKTSTALAQMGYLALGTFYVTGHLPFPAGIQQGVYLTTGLIALSLGSLVVCQRYGVGSSALISALDRCTLGQAKLHWLGQRLAALEAHLTAYYTTHPWRFGRSLLLHFLAFVCDGIQTYLLLCLLLGARAPGFVQAIMVAVAVAILDQLCFLVPGRLGTLEASRFTVLSALGIAHVYGLAFGLVMRLHHLFWTGLGLLAYAVCMRWRGRLEDGPTALTLR